MSKIGLTFYKNLPPDLIMTGFVLSPGLLFRTKMALQIVFEQSLHPFGQLTSHGHP